ncbi:MAG TPA: SAM-dependent methyltransferase [Candidatus Angelobacter sp.]|nr:SAM-dependent methyltransferase [Candidatus Angelobacter sp.]
MILETDVSLSRSVIWRLQREFYVQRGLRAWSEDKVPHFITNNPQIADMYARVVAGFLGDCMAADQSGNPLRILELGAGSGKFCYLFLRHLSARLRVQNIPPETVRYCMTDCSDGLLQTWRENSYLAEFVQSGMLQLERLEAGAEANSKFLNAPGPLVLIANYVFDSLPQDAFVFQDGRIFETLITTTSPGEESSTTPLSSLQFSWRNAEITQNHYTEPLWNSILKEYRSHLPAATVLFPCQVLETLKNIGMRSDGRMLVLAADKGHAHEDQLALCQGAPAIEFHAGNCFSQMVNLDAIGKFCELDGGRAFLPDKHASGLSICGFLQHRPGDLFPATETACRELQQGFGPDDLFALLSWLNAHMEEMSLRHVLAALRLTHWDPVAFMRLFPVIARQIRSAVAERSDLRNAVMRVWENHYPVTSDENVVAFYCGVILLELRFFEDALRMLTISGRLFGQSAATSYNLGLCAQGLGRTSEALAYMEEACRLDPNFEAAKSARLKLENKAVE